MYESVPAGLQESNLMAVTSCRARRAAPAGLSGSQGMAELTDLGQVGSHAQLCLTLVLLHVFHTCRQLLSLKHYATQ